MKTSYRVMTYVLLASGVASFSWADPATVILPAATTAQVTVAPQPQLTWTELQGKVTHVDLQNKVLQIREGKSDSLIEIPVTQNVNIYKSGHHRFDLGDLQEGDHVTVRNSHG